MIPVRFYSPADNEYLVGEETKHAEYNPFAYISYAMTWINAHGKELWSQTDGNNVEKATIRIRYDANVNTRCKLKCDRTGSTLWDIESIDNIRQQNRKMEIRIKRVIRT